MHNDKIIIIPVHMAASKIPNHPLLEVGGKSLLKHTYDKAKQTSADIVLVSTHDPEIIDHCSRHGMSYNLTSNYYFSSSQRCEETFRKYSKMFSSVVNWSYDEPLVEPEWIDILFNSLHYEGYDILTLAAPLTEKDADNPNIVKVAASDGFCRWFSRSDMSGSKAHIGVCIYHRGILKKLAQLSPSNLGRAEKIEQLQWIENGFRVGVKEVDYKPNSIKTPNDWKNFADSFHVQDRED